MRYSANSVWENRNLRGRVCGYMGEGVERIVILDRECGQRKKKSSVMEIFCLETGI